LYRNPTHNRDRREASTAVAGQVCGYENPIQKINNTRNTSTADTSHQDNENVSYKRTPFKSLYDGCCWFKNALVR
jgi:hypothetical protein